MRLFHLVVRFNAAEGGVAVLGPAAQAAEYAALAAARGGKEGAGAAPADLALADVAAAAEANADALFFSRRRCGE